MHRRYRAFMSYSHQDARWAAWLHRKLESYRVPKRLRHAPGAYGPIPERLYPIFRDREDLASSGVLGARLENALSDSEALLVICSPGAARSRWVNAEVENFVQSGRSERIYCLIVDGEPNAGDERECFPPALRLGPDVELIAADVRPGKDGRRRAVHKLLAGLLGVDLDSLRRREAQRQHRRMLFAVIASLSGMLLAMGLATEAWIARNDAKRRQEQAQDLIVYMLGDLHKKLEKVGHLDLLGSLSDTAIGYLEGLNSRDLNDTTLKQLALAMSQLGQVRIGQGRYKDALALFQSAYTRSEALVRRHPENGDLLFDRGQVEYYVGYVYLQSQELDQAQTWFTRYLHTGQELHAMDPSRAKWQREVAYGHSAIAVLEFDRGQLAEAEKGFATAYGILAEALANSPQNPQRIYEYHDALSWLANVREHEGRLQEAEENLASMARTMAGVAKAHPSDPKWRMEWANAELLQSKLLLLLGHFARSESLSSHALGTLKQLVTQDPDNKDWGETYLRAFVRRAAARIGDKQLQAAKADLTRAAPLIRSLGKIQQRASSIRRDIILARQASIWLALHDGDLATAHAGADALQALYKDAKEPGTPEDIGRYGLSQVLAGEVYAALGQPALAKARYAAARRMLEPLVARSRYWQVLDPWVRLSLLSNDIPEANRVRALLATLGYVPVFPWPHAAMRPAAAASVAHATSVHRLHSAPRDPARAHGPERKDKPARIASSP